MAIEHPERTQTAHLFSPLSAGRASDGIVMQIKDLLRRGQLETGDRLPAERRLCEAFGVSRVTVRDALRTLEAIGLVEVKVGAGGGAFIRAPGPDHLAEGLSSLLALRTVSPDELTEARAIIELGLLPTICERANQQDLEDLEALCDRATAALNDGRRHDVDISAAFHVRLAKASHNTAVAFVIESLHGPIAESLAVARGVAPEMGRPGVEEHRQIVRAVRAGDADGAQRVMRGHLDRTRRRVSSALASHHSGTDSGLQPTS